MVNPLIVVINRNRKRNLCALLPDDVFIQHRLEFLRRGQLFRLKGRMIQTILRRKIQFILQNAGAYADALIADIYARARDQLADTPLRLSAKRTFQRLIIIKIRHLAPLPYTSSMLIEYLVDQAVFQRFFCGHEVITLAVRGDDIDRLAGILG